MGTLIDKVCLWCVFYKRVKWNRESVTRHKSGTLIVEGELPESAPFFVDDKNLRENYTL